MGFIVFGVAAIGLVVALSFTLSRHPADRGVPSGTRRRGFAGRSGGGADTGYWGGDSGGGDCGGGGGGDGGGGGC
ncbi:hypothetical protein AA958_17705 [Streptomyces sp. CNQ-509]|uniref:hypothetical protein n=1 Tax=unclassified Streptomyces TaxID=2593676 RepID=UPI00062DD79D|nr:hypothetical protein [Streptomyces sp. CNQ-509]AKH83738.1 hypothetical protein AA958_17705 [Streptomyces sp. CNQ-509]